MTQKRANRFIPDPFKYKRINIKPRDLKILQAVLEEQFLTAQQITTLFFNSYPSAAKRLQQLFHSGYLKRVYAPVSFGSSPAIYLPTQKAVDLLISKNILYPQAIKWKPKHNQVKPEKIRHEIEVNQFKVSLVKAIQNQPNLKLLSCTKGSELWDRVKPLGSSTYIPIRPDRFLILQINNIPQYFFLELDRSTMPLARFKKKIIGYRAYYFQEGFLRKYGNPKTQTIKDMSFRVLVIAPTQERRNNLVEQAISLGTNMTWFTTYQQAIEDPLGKIWLRPKEYKQALSYLPLSYKPIPGRNFERDKIIKKHASLLTLL